jgi:O-methyltransferase involved in polyketide biosynthesis
MEDKDVTNRNFSTISPSAKWLLYMKGHTGIPFARETAGLMKYPEKFVPDFNRRDLTFWARTLHFENRYLSIDQLLNELPVKNILELSSGFSFRGLEKASQKGIYYIDTDLPDVINAKKEFISALQDVYGKPQGKLELLPMNALDEEQFTKTVNRFPDGEIAIVNEGLLMYLDANEKEKLCRNIFKILKERGGCWITADIYLKNRLNKLNLKLDDKTREFFEEHHVEENRFESFGEAEAFFKRMGFRVEKEAEIDPSRLSSLKYFRKSLPFRQLFKFRKAGKIQTTWRLKC